VWPFDFLVEGDGGGGDLRLKKLEIEGLASARLTINHSLNPCLVFGWRHSITNEASYGDATSTSRHADLNIAVEAVPVACGC
jgi:hypothetical protein